MILYEHEGKALLSNAGFALPDSQLITKEASPVRLKLPLVLKAQVLSGKRAVAGGIVQVTTEAEILPILRQMLGHKINGEKVEKVLIEEAIVIEQSWYISLSYDTTVRKPVMSWSNAGGTGIEERKIETHPIDPLSPSVSNPTPLPDKLVQGLIDLFFQADCLLLEINPLVYGSNMVGKKDWYVLDAKTKLDDSATGRHSEWSYGPRSVAGRIPTEREVLAKQIDQKDYRGTAGSSYLDLDGDIAVLASGGGASLVAMDALLTSGGRPANYTEYSGNPPREKVEKLTEVVLSKPNLCGLWIVGAVANFTDIYETLSGIVAGLTRAEKTLSKKFDFPILVRRGGPRDEEAFAFLRTIPQFKFQIYGPEISIAEAAKIMTKLASEYRLRKNKS